MIFQTWRLGIRGLFSNNLKEIKEGTARIWGNRIAGGRQSKCMEFRGEWLVCVETAGGPPGPSMGTRRMEGMRRGEPRVGEIESYRP